MSVVLEADAVCVVCAARHPAKIEFMWGADSPWHGYRIGANIRWKPRRRDAAIPSLGVRLSELDPVWIHGSGVMSCGHAQDFLIEIRDNRIRGVRTLPPTPPKLLGFGWYGTPPRFFVCGHKGPGQTWPTPLDESDLGWLRAVAESTADGM